MSIKIIKPALLTTLVSDGRVGFRSFGIGPGGAMDFFAMKVANGLVGNDREAVIEVGYSSAEFFVQCDGVAAVTGKGFDVYVNDEVFFLWKPFTVKWGTILKLKKTSSGAWAYLSISGGWKAHEWLHSFTTNLSAKAGGFQGRLLQKEDVIEANKNEFVVDENKALPWGISTNELTEIYSSANEIRCIASVETDLLSLSSKENFESNYFMITAQSSRMGYRLKGEPLLLSKKMEMISSPVDFGTVQLLPDGNLIVLMADHQTTGGYPRIASVIKADLPKLTQVMPGEKIKFKMISLKEAKAELASREQMLTDLEKSCRERFKKNFQV